MLKDSILYNFQEAATGNNFSSVSDIKQNWIDSAAGIRLSRTGRTEAEAKKYGIHTDLKGTIHIPFLDFKGNPKKGFNLNANGFAKTLYKKRYSAEAIKERVNIAIQQKKAEKVINEISGQKYGNPSRYEGLITPMPNQKAIDSDFYSIIDNQPEHKILCVFESFFSAFSCDLSAVAMNGINDLGIQGERKQELREWIIKNEIKEIWIFPDGDKLKPELTETGIYTASSITKRSRILIEVVESYLDFIKENGLKTKLFLKIQQTKTTKDFEELLAEFLANGKSKKEFYKTLFDSDSNTYFHTIQIKRTLYKADIKQYFATQTYFDFYRKWQFYIQYNPFYYKGAIYQRTSQSADKVKPFFQMENHFIFKVLNQNEKCTYEKISVGKTIIIQKYLGEEEAQIIETIDANDIIMISAGTGTGKTTILNYYIKAGIKTAVLVPTVQLAKQISRLFRIPYLSAGKSINRNDIPLCVVATYDSIGKINDLEERYLFIDEIHKLIDDWGNASMKLPFRADAVRKVFNLSKIAKKVIGLSGTMYNSIPLIFSLANEEKKVAKMNFQRLQSNDIFLHRIQTKDSLFEAVNFTTKHKPEAGKIGIVYVNDIDFAESLQAELINSGTYTKAQINILNRRYINEFEETQLIASTITQTSELKYNEQEPTLYIVTCVIGEGLNIVNENIDWILTLKVQNPSELIQFVNRFRNQKEINIYDVKPFETDLKEDFFIDTQRRIIAYTQKAKIDCELIEAEKKAIKFDLENPLPFSDLTEYGEDITIIFDSNEDIVSNDETRNIFASNTDYTYKLNGLFEIDYLAIANSINRNIYEAGNNAYFDSKLLDSGNIFHKGEYTYTNEEPINLIADEVEANEELIIHTLKNEIALNPIEPIKALFWYYIQTLQPEQEKRILRYCPDLKDILTSIEEAPEYYSKNETIFKTTKILQRRIWAYIFFRNMGANFDFICKHLFNDTLSAAQNLSQFYHNLEVWKLISGLNAYKEPNKRRYITNPQTRKDLKKIRDFGNTYLAKHLGKRVKLKDIIKEYKWDCYNKKIEPEYSKYKIQKLISELFIIEQETGLRNTYITIKQVAENPFQELPNGNDFRTFLTYLN